MFYIANIWFTIKTTKNPSYMGYLSEKITFHSWGRRLINESLASETYKHTYASSIIVR